MKETGVGVGVRVKSTIIYKHLKCKLISSFKVTMAIIKLTNRSKLVLQYIASGTFLKKLSELLEILCVMHDEVISVNINLLLETDNPVVDSLYRLWESSNFLFLTHNTSKINNLLVEDVQMSDHYMISFETGLRRSLSFQGWCSRCDCYFA